MQIKIGTDIVKVNRFKDTGNTTLNKIFHKTELKNKKPEVLAGIFAAKESCKKVFNKLNWLDIEIIKTKTGKPELLLNHRNPARNGRISRMPEKDNELSFSEHIKENIINYDVSISHDGEYAVSTVVFLIEDENKK